MSHGVVGVMVCDWVIYQLSIWMLGRRVSCKSSIVPVSRSSKPPSRQLHYTALTSPEHELSPLTHAHHAHRSKSLRPQVCQGIAFDVVVNNRRAIENSSLLSSYAAFDPRARDLIFLVHSTSIAHSYTHPPSGVMLLTHVVYSSLVLSPTWESGVPRE